MSDPSLVTFSDDSLLSASHPNPVFQYTTVFLPRKLKDLFRWAEYLYGSNSQISASVSKLASYIVTDIEIDTGGNKQLDEWHRDILFKKAKIYNLLTRAAKEGLYFYGNFICSISYPFKRQLKCTKCGSIVSIEKSNFTFIPSKAEFKFFCSKCNTNVTAEVKDTKDLNPDRIHFIKWDPKFVDINYNKYSGKEEIWVHIDAETKARVKNKDKFFLASTPIEIIKGAVSKEGTMRLTEGEFYHVKNEGLSGMSQDWGYPMVAWTLKDYINREVLKKANEAISYDYLVPFRILFPSSQSGVDPFQYVNLSKWKSEVGRNLKKWRRDPLHIEISPIPLGTATVGGQGKALLTYNEIQMATDDILAGIGLPKEIHYGGMQFKGLPLSLRMMEKFLQSGIDQLNDLLQWVDDKLSDYFGKQPAKVKMAPFRLLDNMDEKIILAQMIGNEMLSKKTGLGMYGIDYEKEIKNIEAEQIDMIQLQKKIQEKQTEIMGQQQMQPQQNIFNGSLDAIKNQARAYAEQLVQQPENVRRSYLASLKKDNYVLYAVVVDMMDDIRRTAAQEGRAQQGI